MSKAIIITHGLFMKKQVMFFLASEFEKLGYKVYNFNYNSLKFSNDTIEEFKKFTEQVEEEHVYFIGHSLGGLLIRHFFETYKPKYIDTCIITLGTPHKGSSFGKRVMESKIGKIIGTSPNSGMTTGLGEWNRDLADLGCVIGTLNIGLNSFFNYNKSAGDGTVLIEEAYAENCNDIFKININHTSLIYSKKIVTISNNFILKRKFI